jgi:molecular chaperone DnaJ
MADYYEILGVARDASTEDIKRAFRRLARETHPDSNPGDPQAEGRFREIAQAYEVLSNPQRRAAYDRGDTIDMGDLFSSFAGIDELLARMFGGFGGFGGRPAGPASGADARVTVEVDLAGVASGVTREVEYRAAVACATCGGDGAAPGTALERCSRCDGQGSVRAARQTLLGTAMTITACDVCRGRGRVVTEPCPECRGAGSIADVVTLEVEVPPGVEDGTRLRLTGRGSAGEPGGRPGDLYVDVRVTPDDRFDRHGPDLVHRTSIGLSEAALGTTIEVPTVGADPIEVDVPAGTQPGAVFKLSKQGLPRLGRRGRGDLLVEVGVEIPTRLSKEAEDALRSYAEVADESPHQGRRHRR